MSLGAFGNTVVICPSSCGMPSIGSKVRLAASPAEAAGVTVTSTTFSPTLSADAGAANPLCRSFASQPLPNDGPLK